MRLIDADALIISLAKDRSALVNNHVQHGEICRVDETIWKVVDAPTIDAVPVVRGEWIEPDENDITTACICSLCDWRGHIMEDDVMGMPYCPNCGAKMEDKQ